MLRKLSALDHGPLRRSSHTASVGNRILKLAKRCSGQSPAIGPRWAQVAFRIEAQSSRDPFWGKYDVYDISMLLVFLLLLIVITFVTNKI